MKVREERNYEKAVSMANTVKRCLDTYATVEKLHKKGNDIIGYYILYVTFADGGTVRVIVEDFTNTIESHSVVDVSVYANYLNERLDKFHGELLLEKAY